MAIDISIGLELQMGAAANEEARVEKQQAARAMDSFLAGIEKKAYRIAYLGTRNPDDALDVVQNAMLAFVRNYTRKPEEQWAPLFFKVLRSRIADWHRRRAVRSRWMAFTGRAGDDYDPVESAEDIIGKCPGGELGNSEAGAAIELAVQALPMRQQQAFLLRTWQGFNVKQTAISMGCSEGSVKTHLSRAMSALRISLEGLGTGND